MEELSVWIIRGCLFASAFFVLLLVVYLVISGNLANASYRLKKTGRSFRLKLSVTAFLLLLAVWFLRFAVGYYSIRKPDSQILGLTPVEEFFNSFIHALQSFSLDEQYEQFIIEGKEMMATVFPGTEVLKNIYGVYASALNALAPVASGAVVIELISEFFPSTRLFFVRFCVWNEQCYFSELNDRSIALAKSLMASRKRRISIIFSDCNPPDKDKDKYEDNLATAKSIGAVCVKGDLAHIGFTTLLTPRRIKFFLIDEKENNNLEMLTSMLERKRDRRAIKLSEIYVFASDQISSPIDEEIAFIINQLHAQVFSSLKNKEENPGKNNRELDNESADILRKTIPTIIPVNGIRNLVSNLFVELPLYEAVIDKKSDPEGKKDLNVTILGGGQIGTECFLTAYWCGQMPGIRLNLTVVSKEEEDCFRGKINYINREILETEDQKSNLLYYDATNKNTPYLSFKYKQADILTADFLSLLEEPGTIADKYSLLDTDYFVVALGSDEENFAIADKLRQRVGEYHLNNKEENRTEYKTIISYSIYNPQVCRALNNNNAHHYIPDNNDFADVYMYAFGNIEEVNSVKNVFFDGVYSTGDTYNHLKYGETELAHKKVNLRKFRDIYSYQANLARRIYRKYLEYSAGFHTKSVFSLLSKEDYRDYQKIEADAFIKMIECDMLNDNGTGRPVKTLPMLHTLAQTEHRRWCAYMRTKGFHCPAGGFTDYSQLDTFEHSKYDHKFIPLKIHPCLVECGDYGIHADFDDKGLVITESEFKEVPETEMDNLDWFSYTRHNNHPKLEDCKQWDYPQFGIDDKELLRATDSLPSRKKTCSFSPSGDVMYTMIYTFDNTQYISVEQYQKLLKKVASRINNKRKKERAMRVADNLQSALTEINATIEFPGAGIDTIAMIRYSSIDALYEKMMKLDSRVFSKDSK